MPELPEVETVRRGLIPVLNGAVIAQADVNRPDLRWPMPTDMAARLTGRRVLQLRRRSKYILADLDSGETLLIHLGMSGRIQISGATIGGFFHDHAPTQKHDHVVLHLAGGARVTYNDARRFGMMDLMKTDQIDTHPLIANLGPEPLGNTFDESYLVDRIKSRKAPIKNLLLDQRIIAGLGNIYVCEVLFRGGISPKRVGQSIPKSRIAALVPIIRDVLSEAIEAGGSSLKDYRQTDGELGYFQHSFAVYGREGGTCLAPQCTGGIARINQSGRSSFYCPQCQR